MVLFIPRHLRTIASNAILKTIKYLRQPTWMGKETARGSYISLFALFFGLLPIGIYASWFPQQLRVALILAGGGAPVFLLMGIGDTLVDCALTLTLLVLAVISKPLQISCALGGRFLLLCEIKARSFLSPELPH